MIGLAEQTVLALIVGLSLCVVAGYYYSVHLTADRWIEIDEAPPKEYAFQLDINQAPWPELSMLPGVGESLAKRIVDDRELNGPFENVEQVMRVHGIGEKKVPVFASSSCQLKNRKIAHSSSTKNRRKTPGSLVVTTFSIRSKSVREI